MNIDQLNETFTAHEALAPDPDVVLAKSRQIARELHRRRWAVRATGGAVLGAGIAAGGFAVPGLVGGSSHGEAVVEAASGGGGSAASTAGSFSEDQELMAYFNAGYNIGDARQLAKLWHETGDLAAVKAEAGAQLLDGQTLPIAPSGTPATADELAWQAFFNAGYDSSDAAKLASMWHETDITQVKTEAGRKLENGETLPIAPSGKTGKAAAITPVDPSDAALSPSGSTISRSSRRDLDAYYRAGYDYSDAQQLAKLWHQPDTFQVKVEAGQKLLDGETLPVAP